MRITNGMMSKNMLNNLQLNMKRMNKLNAQGTSGKLFEKPSDAPVEMARSLKLYTDISRVNQYERNVRDAQSWLHSTEDAITEVTEILKRTRELSVEMASGTKTESDTQKAAIEISQLKDQLIKLANTTHAGRSIFSGYQTNKDLMSTNGTYALDLTSEEVSIYNVGIAENLEVNILGSRLFGVRNETKAEFKEIDGKNSIEIDLGVDNKQFRDLEVEIVKGDVEGAKWSNNKLIVTLEKGKIYDGVAVKAIMHDGTNSKIEGVAPQNASDTFDASIIGISIKGSIGTVSGNLGDSKTGTVDGTKTTFEKIDGKDDLIINLGVAANIEIIKGDTDSAVWDTGKFTITLSEGNKSSSDIAKLIANAELANKDSNPPVDDLPAGYDASKVLVSTENRLNGSEVRNGVIPTRRINTDSASSGQKSHMIDVFDKLINAMGTDAGGAGTSKFNQDEVSKLIDSIDGLMGNALILKAEVGAKVNRIDMTSNRLTSEKLNFTTVLSENEDVDLAEVIMKFNMAEAIYNASLSMGGRSIQQTLVDFLR